MAVQLGKRYVCEVCGTEILCTKGSEGDPECDGKPMALQQARVLPASD